MEKHKSIDVLNSLITINNDRLQGYETAIKETEDHDLTSLFTQFIQTSKSCKNELITAVTQAGGEPSDGTRLDGEMYRVWMDFKALISGRDRKTILSSCERGEDAAVNTYEEALKHKDLPEEHRTMINAQFAKIKADHDQVKKLRDATVHA